MSAITEITGFAHLHGLPCYRLTFANASVVVSCYGGQVLSYQPVPGQELLYLSPLTCWQQQQAIRGGVPICWPWFGAIANALNPQQQPLPNHGLVRNRIWSYHSEHLSQDACQLCLSIVVEDIPVLPRQRVTLCLTLTLNAEGLSINLSCDQPLLQQAALHSYFRVSALETCQLEGIGTQFIDKVAATTGKLQIGELRFVQEIDRIYTTPTAMLSLQSALQQVNISQHGMDSTVVWNPFSERSVALKDLPNEGYQDFICVESAHLAITTAEPLNLTQRLSLG